MLPLSIQKMERNRLDGNIDETILQGFYPRIFDQGIDGVDFYPSYIQTYLEKDIRLIDMGGALYPVEVKSSETINSSYFSALNQWNEISGVKVENGAIIYGGIKVKKGRTAG